MPLRTKVLDGEKFELAIISQVAFGLRDTDYPVLSFTANMIGRGSLQAFEGRDIHNFIVDNNVTDIRNLEGKALIVVIEDGIMYSVRLFP